MMKFKIGDKVRVKESISWGDTRGGIEFIYDMEKYIGKIICVEDADWEDNTYLYDGYWFCEEWLEEVEATKILFAKVKPDAIIPTKREEDAGFDIYSLFDEESIVINPHETLSLTLTLSPILNFIITSFLLYYLLFLLFLLSTYLYKKIGFFV